MNGKPSNVVSLAGYRAGEHGDPSEHGPHTIAEAERLVWILARDCHDLDDLVSVLHTLSYNGIRLGDLPADPMVLAGWAKQFRNMARDDGSEPI